MSSNIRQFSIRRLLKAGSSRMTSTGNAWTPPVSNIIKRWSGVLSLKITCKGLSKTRIKSNTIKKLKNCNWQTRCVVRYLWNIKVRESGRRLKWTQTIISWLYGIWPKKKLSLSEMLGKSRYRLLLKGTTLAWKSKRKSKDGKSKIKYRIRGMMEWRNRSC